MRLDTFLCVLRGQKYPGLDDHKKGGYGGSEYTYQLEIL